jgi:hypothetical protein
MLEMGTSGSEGGVALIPPSLPLSPELGRGIYPAGTLALTRARKKSHACVASTRPCGLKSALRAPESALEQQGESP